MSNQNCLRPKNPSAVKAYYLYSSKVACVTAIIQLIYFHFLDKWTRDGNTSSHISLGDCPSVKGMNA